MTFENRVFKIRVLCVLSLFLLSFMVLIGRSVQLHLFADARIAKMDKQNNRNIKPVSYTHLTLPTKA